MKYYKLLFLLLLCIPVFSHALPAITLSGHGDGVGTIIFADIEMVKQILPKRLELVSSKEFPKGTHPVMFLFVTQTNLSLINKDQKIPLAKEYKEIILLTQNVRFKGGTKTYSYFKKLYLDNIAAVVGGWYLSYPKSYGHFEFNSGNYTSTNRAKQDLVAAKFQKKENYDAAMFAVKFDQLQSTLRDVVADKFGKLECSQFTWDLTQAVTYPVDSVWKITPQFSKIFAGEYITPGLDISLAGGFSMAAPWTLTGPLKCE